MEVQIKGKNTIIQRLQTARKSPENSEPPNIPPKKMEAAETSENSSTSTSQLFTNVNIFSLNDKHATSYSHLFQTE